MAAIFLVDIVGIVCVLVVYISTLYDWREASSGKRNGGLDYSGRPAVDRVVVGTVLFKSTAFFCSKSAGAVAMGRGCAGHVACTPVEDIRPLVASGCRSAPSPAHRMSRI